MEMQNLDTKEIHSHDEKVEFDFLSPQKLIAYSRIASYAK
jgi:hypothetical protein